MGSNHERVKMQSDATFVRPRWCGVSHHVSLFSSISVGMEMMFCTEGCTAVIDTGSSYITGPASSVSLLMKTIGAQLDESGVTTCNVHSYEKESNTHIKYPICPLIPYPWSCSTKSTVMLWRHCPASHSTWEVRSTPLLRRTIFCG